MAMANVAANQRLGEDDQQQQQQKQHLPTDEEASLDQIVLSNLSKNASNN
jgi:hypothetical protein